MSSTSTITTAQKTWETYTASWRSESSSDRTAAFEASLSPNCTYADPLASTTGWKELTAYMDGLQQQLPGAHFVTTRFLAHEVAGSTQSCAVWNMCDGDGNVLSDGFSFGKYGDDGKLVSMTGFFEPPEA